MSYLKALFTLFCCSYVVAVSAQVFHPENGVDLFPVYQSSIPDCYIDSIIYTGPFVVFCVTFRKRVEDKTYTLEGIRGDKSWVASTGSSYERPLVIRKVSSNGIVLADYVREENLTIPLTAYKGSDYAVISCQFQFWRGKFQHNRTILREYVEDVNVIQPHELVFNTIRLRTSHYNHAVSKELADFYKKDYQWGDKALVKKTALYINEEPISANWETTIPPKTYQPLSYKVEEHNKSKLFLQGMRREGNTTIFKVTTCAYKGHRLYLHSKKKEGFFIQMGRKKIPMQGIKNITVNKNLIKKEVQEGELLLLRRIQSPFFLSFEIHFEDLPTDLTKFDLLEVVKKNGSHYLFSFFEVEAAVVK